MTERRDHPVTTAVLSAAVAIAFVAGAAGAAHAQAIPIGIYDLRRRRSSRCMHLAAYRFSPVTYRNAAIAAVAPSPAAAASCATEFARMSPAANTPASEVRILMSVSM
jgi:hypothetical protein